MPKVAVIYYSTYGHVRTLAQEVSQALQSMVSEHDRNREEMCVGRHFERHARALRAYAPLWLVLYSALPPPIPVGSRAR